MKTSLHTTKHLRRSSAAFTLIEIMLVLAIIALLMGVGIYKLSGVTDKGKQTKVKSDINTIMIALRSYEIDAGSFPPTQPGLSVLVENPGNVKNWTRSLDEALLDPWKNEYGYRYPAKKNQTGKPDIFSRGPDGQEDTEDDIGNW
jgi:general secretion pathway protein G